VNWKGGIEDNRRKIDTNMGEGVADDDDCKVELVWRSTFRPLPLLRRGPKRTTTTTIVNVTTGRSLDALGTIFHLQSAKRSLGGNILAYTDGNSCKME
jgi:hypothetical protein